MTCGAAGAECGALDDGCGHTLDCGGCHLWLTCGGGGTPGQCGASCNPRCPAGYTCDGSGVCVGGFRGQVNVDIEPIDASGRLTLNGAPYPCQGTVPTPAWYPLAMNTIIRADATGTGTCGAAVGYRVGLYPGDFRVEFSGGSNGLGRITLPAPIVLSQPASINLDLVSHPVEGRLQVNNGPITCGFARSLLHFRSPNHVLTLDLCQGNGAFSAQLTPGTYDVVFQQDDVMDIPATVARGVEVQGPISNLEFAVTAATLQLSLSYSGNILPDCAGNRPRFYATNLETGDMEEARFACGSNQPVHAAPGAYDLELASNTSGSQGIRQRIGVIRPGTETSQSFDLRPTPRPLRLLRNGQTPAPCDWSTLSYRNSKDPSEPGLYVSYPCTEEHTLSLPNGEFDLFWGVRDLTQVLVAKGVSADTLPGTLDVLTFEVAVSVRVDGAAAPSDCARQATFYLFKDNSEYVGAQFRCNDGPKTLHVPPGRYYPKFSDSGRAYIGRPVIITGPDSLAFDFETLQVSGRVMVGGAPPVVASCVASYGLGNIYFWPIGPGSGSGGSVEFPCSGSTDFNMQLGEGIFAVLVEPALLGSSTLPDTRYVHSTRLELRRNP